MITIQYTNKLPYPTVCYGCGKKNDEKGIRIEVENPDRMRGVILYLCDACRRELYEKI